MPRIQYSLPEQFVFSTDMQIYTSHINWGGHLDNAQLLTLVSEARVRFFQWLGYTEGQIEHCSIVVGDMLVQYKSEAFHGETLNISMAANDFHAFGCDLVWCMHEALSGREVARGKTGIVFFDYTERRKAPVPAGFRRRFAADSPTSD